MSVYNGHLSTEDSHDSMKVTSAAEELAAQSVSTGTGEASTTSKTSTAALVGEASTSASSGNISTPALATTSTTAVATSSSRPKEREDKPQDTTLETEDSVGQY